MNVNGISSNYYLTDNPIFVNLSNIDFSTDHVAIFARNTRTQEVSVPMNYYPYGNQNLNIDIAPLVKSMMSEPDHAPPLKAVFSAQPQFGQKLFESYFNGNLITLEITFRERTSSTSFYDEKRTRTFIRGGKRTYQSNQNLSYGDILSPTSIIPTWRGYPAAYYLIGRIDTETTIGPLGVVKSIRIPADKRKNLKVKGCNPQYVKFLNSLGGYSYWLFENWETEETNDNLGGILRRNEVLDLGNSYDKSVKLTSKIPKEFLPLIKDLIVSKEIYLYDRENQDYIRVSSEKNRVKENPFSVNFKVDLKFKLHNRYNPSLTW